MKTSRIPGFYKMPVNERLKALKKYGNLDDDDINLLGTFGSLSETIADMMIENVVGCMPLPLGIATNFIINNKEVLIPMAVEETSVVAAASNAAKMARPDGFKAWTDDPIMIGQIQLLNPSNDAIDNIMKHKQDIIDYANQQDKILVKFGGGAQNIELKLISDDMLIIHLLVDVRDAMGANAVNTMVEAIAPLLEELSGGKALLRILSNLAVYRTAEAEVIYKKVDIGRENIDKIIKAYQFAALDPFRTATHNKGIMNGIDAVVLATGNDWRAIEAGAHAYAAINQYKPLTEWKTDKEGNLYGHIKLPIAVGTVGGATKIHPIAQIALKILDIKSASELAQIMAAVGLAQNFAAIRALATKGIQAGHMKLHAQNIAYMAGARNKEIDIVAQIMIDEKTIRMDTAEILLKKLRKNKKI